METTWSTSDNMMLKSVDTKYIYVYQLLYTFVIREFYYYIIYYNLFLFFIIIYFFIIYLLYI